MPRDLLVVQLQETRGIVGENVALLLLAQKGLRVLERERGLSLSVLVKQKPRVSGSLVMRFEPRSPFISNGEREMLPVSFIYCPARD